MLNHRFVFVSKNDEFKFGRDKSDAFQVEHPTVRFDYVQNNAQPLADVYNLMLDENCSGDFDYVYFMHADVSLDFLGLIRHVESVAGKYDLIGLCGCAKFCVSQSPLNWFCGSNPFPQFRWGCVTHGELGNQTSFFSQHSPDVTDHEVACIDGLCIIFSKNAVKAGLRFDNSLGSFDFYDSDISMQAVLRYGFKIGVVVRKDLQHYSIGRSILTKDFLQNEAKFRKKWDFRPPAGSFVEKVMNGQEGAVQSVHG